MIGAKTSFFDTQPTGRILNRFSKDIYSVDEVKNYFYFIILFECKPIAEYSTSRRRAIKFNFKSIWSDDSHYNR